MQVVKVSDKKTIKYFHNLPKEIYRNDSNWVCPLREEIEQIFDPQKNKLFEQGDAQRWIVIKGKKPVGRIAAFYSKKESEKWEQPTGGIGFFECIDDIETATFLFDTAKNWLQSNGMEAMDGPGNFGENFYHTGLLVDGFVAQGYGMPYHKSYYKDLWEIFGFKLFFKQFSYHFDLKAEFPERFWKVADRVVNTSDVECRHFRFDEKEKFIKDVVDIYNETWESFREESSSLTYDDVYAAFMDAKDIIEEELIWFVYKNGEPACFMVMIPDANQILIHLNGELNFWSKLKFLYHKKRKTINRTRSFVMGIKPKFQRLGLESAMFWNLKPVFEKLDHYMEVELSWSGDFNPRVLSLYEAVGAKRKKTHHTYRYLFDREKPFIRYQMPEMNRIPRRARKQLNNQE